MFFYCSIGTALNYTFKISVGLNNDSNFHQVLYMAFISHK